MKNYIMSANIKNIKFNRKTYIALSVGIILSTILITLAFTVVYNFNLSEINGVKKESGDYQFSFENVDTNKYELLKKDKKVDQSSVSRIYFDTGKVFNEIPRLKVDLLRCDKNTFETILNLQIKEGRIPQNGNELMMEQWISKREKLKINDSITTTINGKSKSFKIVGLYANFNSSQYQNKVNFYSIIDGDKLKEEIQCIFFNLNKDVDVAKSFSFYRNMVGNSHFKPNDDLLVLTNQHEQYKNGDNKAMTIGLLIPISVTTMIIIFNVLEIMLLQRIKEFGVFRSLGANRKDIIKLILGEVLVISIIVAFFGIGLFYILSKIASILLMNLGVLESSVKLSLGIVIKSYIITITTIFIAALLTGRRISKIPCLDALYGKYKVKEKKYKVRFFRKYYGLELDISNRSMRMNKRKYKLTLRAITVTLLIFFIYFSSYSFVKSLLTTLPQHLKTQYNIFLTDKTKGSTLNIYDDLRSIKGIDKLYTIYNPILSKAYVSESHLSDSYKEFIKNNNITKDFNKDVELRCFIHVYDSERLKNASLNSYLMDGNIDLEKLQEEVILVRNSSIEEKKHKFKGTITNLKAGESIELFDKKVKIPISAIVSDDPFIGYNGYDKNESSSVESFNSEIRVIISDKLYNKVFKDNLKIQGYDVIFKENIDKENTKNEIMTVTNKHLKDATFVEKDDSMKKRTESLNKIFQVSIIIISLICCTSLLILYNTIKSNVLLRRREIAMFKAIGMDNSRVNKLILYESLIYALKAWLRVTIFGTVIMEVFYMNIKKIQYFIWSMPIYIPIILLIIAILMSLISVIPSLRYIKKDSIIEQIRC